MLNMVVDSSDVGIGGLGDPIHSMYGIYAIPLTPLAPPQLIGSPMACLGMVFAQVWAGVYIPGRGWPWPQPVAPVSPKRFHR